jgi:hypothetical protein
LSRLVRSCSAWYCATTAFSTSFPMEGSTRSSQSGPRFCRGQKRGAQGRVEGALQRSVLCWLRGSHTDGSPSEQPGRGRRRSPPRPDSLQVSQVAGLTRKILARSPTSGLDSTRSVMLTICRSASGKEGGRTPTRWPPARLVGRPPCCCAVVRAHKQARLPFVPVTELMERGRVRMSITFGVWNQGIRKCVPSPTGAGRMPDTRSYMMARSPPSTAGFRGALLEPLGGRLCGRRARQGRTLGQLALASAHRCTGKTAARCLQCLG